MNTIEKCIAIIERELKYLSTKDEAGQFGETLSQDFDEFSYEGKKALEIISHYNLIYFRGTNDLKYYSRHAEITDEGKEALKVEVKKYFASFAEKDRNKIGFIQ